MFEIAGGILIAVLVIWLAPIIFAAAFVAILVLILISLCVAVYYNFEIAIIFLCFFGFIMLLTLVTDHFDKKREIANHNGRKEKGWFSPYDDLEIPKKEIRISERLQEFESNKIKSIGGVRIWLLDIYRRNIPALSITQKISKQRYIEIERPQLFIDATNAMRLKLEIAENERQQKELADDETNRAIAIKKLEEYTENKTKDVRTKLKWRLSELKRKFESMSNVVFDVGEECSYITIYKNDVYYASYQIYADVRISQANASQSIRTSLVKKVSDDYNTFVLYHIVDDNEKTVIASKKNLADLKKYVREKLISDAAKA